MPDVRSPQHLVALERAHAVRLRAAAVKRALKSGTMSIATAFDEECVQKWYVADLIGYACIGGPAAYLGNRAPKPSPRAALEVINRLNLGLTTHVRSLSPERRAEVVRAVEELHGRVRATRRPRFLH